MGIGDVGKPEVRMSMAEQPQTQQQQQSRQQDYDDADDQYALQQDNYTQRIGANNWSLQMMKVVLDTKITNQTDFDNYKEMIVVAVDNLRRIPNIPIKEVNMICRDFDDICDLAQCQGTKRMVASRMQKLVFRICALVSCGESELHGLTGISTIITSRQQSDQQIKMPQQPEQSKGGFFGFMKR